MLLVLVAVATAIAATLIFFHRRHSYWASRGIISPPGRFIIGHLDKTAKPDNPIPLQIQKWTKEYGSLYGFYEGTRRVLVVNDPEMLQELFVKKYEHFYGRKSHILAPAVDTASRVHLFESRGARWKRFRTLAAPAFSAGNLKKVQPTVEDSALEMLRHLDKVQPGSPVNIHKYFQEFTIDVISRVALGQKGTMQFRNPYTENVLDFFNRNLFAPLCLVAFTVPWLQPFVRNVEHYFGHMFGTNCFVSLMTQVSDAVEQRIQQRETNNNIEKDENTTTTDYIDLFLDMKDDDIAVEKNEFTKQAVQVQRAMSKEEIVAQCFIFLLAGFDTTANSLGYVSHLLAKNPRVMEKLHEEIDREFTEESISSETLSRLNYMDCVVKESLRMYPLAAFASSRECMVDSSLGGVPIEKGTFVTADVWSVHYDPKIWGDDAHEFRPERWESSERRALTSWFPFGIGPRQCIGMRLALMEEKVALAHLLRKYTIEKGPETEKELTLFGCMTTSPAAVTVYLRERDI